MTTPRDPDRLIREFLLEGEEQLQDQVYDVVRAEIEQKRQRVFFGPWRLPTMNKFVTYGLAAAAVVAVLFVGSQLFGSPTGGLGSDPTHHRHPRADAGATPSPSAESGLPRRSVPRHWRRRRRWTRPCRDHGHIASPGWSSFSASMRLSKNDDGLDSTGLSAMCSLRGLSQPGPGSMCTEIPATGLRPSRRRPPPRSMRSPLPSRPRRPATLSAPVDITLVDSPARRSRSTADVVDCRTRHARKCSRIATRAPSPALAPGRHRTVRTAQGPGQIDEMWILDVDGSIVILNVVYGPDTPAALIDEMRAIVESATFEAP